MKLLTKRILSMLLALLMVLSVTGNVVSAQPAEGEPQQSIIDDQYYKPHEAIVMAYVDDTTKSSNSDRLFQATKEKGKFERSEFALAGDTIAAETTYEFDTKAAVDNNLNSAKSSAVTRVPKKLQVSRVVANKLSTEALIKAIKGTYSNIVAVEPNYIVKADRVDNDYKDYQWALDNKVQNQGTADKDVNPERAWAAADTEEQVIAVIDSGIDYSHEALQGCIWENDTDLEGTCGYDFVNKDSDPMDDLGHGTHCAGIIAGNGNRVLGVAQHVKLMALKFLGSDGYGSSYDAIAAYDYINRAMKKGVNVVAINNSWGGGDGSEIFETLVDLVGEKGAITVTSSGNEESNMDIYPDRMWGFDSDYKITVAASNEKGELADFSNYGENHVDIAAPGTDILSSVSYNVYNPTIHSGAEQADYSEIYDDFSDDLLPDACKQFSIDLTTMKKNSSLTMSIDREEDFGLNGDTKGSLGLSTACDCERDTLYGAYWPITLPASSTPYYLSAMMKGKVLSSNGKGENFHIYCGVAKVSLLERLYNNTDDPFNTAMNLGYIGAVDCSKKTNYWTNVNGNTGLYEAKPGEYAFYVFSFGYYDNTYKFNIDNLGFSKKDMEESSFGKYDFYNGTSMAAPYVTGSVALMKQCYPELSTEDLRDKVANCGRVEEELAGCTHDGRNLDLSYFDKNVFSIESFYYEEGKVKLTGFGLSEVQTVKINGNQASITGQKDNELILSAGNCANKKVSFDITLKDSTNITKTEYISYNTIDFWDVTSIDDFEKGSVVSDGSTLYSYGGKTFGSFNAVSDVEEWVSNPIIENSCIDTDIIETLAGEPAKLKTNLFYDNHKIYALAQSSVSYYATCAIVVYDTASQEWSKLCDLPDTIQMNNMAGSNLAVYNGKLYLMGGMDEKTLQVKNAVYAYDFDEETWSTKDPLPENRAFANANVVKGKLMLTFGTVDGQVPQENVAPVPLILSGDEWSKSAATCKAVVNREVQTEMNQYSYYDVSVGTCTKGLIFAGLVSEDYGDVFYYNADSDSYEAYKDCSLYPYTKLPEYNGGASVADQFYFFGTGEQIIKEDELGNLFYGYRNKLFRMSMDTGYWRVSGEKENCQYEGTGYYLPGESAEISIIPDDGYLVVGYRMDGEDYEGATVTIDAVEKDYNIVPVTIPIATGIEFLKDSYEIVAGKNLSIGLKLLPVGAKEEITWSVNSSYSSISNGVLKTSIKDAGRDLTVTAETESGLTKTCKVKVLRTVQSITLNKNKIVLLQGASFKLNAVASPKNAVNERLIYTTSNPSVAMVNDSGDLIGIKPGKVVITISTAAVNNITPVKVQCSVTVVAPVNKVTKLKAKSATNQITLTWNAVKSADGYVVYRYDSKTKKDVKLATIKGGTKTSYTVKRLLGSKGNKLAAGTAYIFKVMAYDAVEGTVFYGPKASISTCTTPNVSSIKGLTNSKKGQLNVTWSKASGVNGYKIYVCNKSGGTYQLKGTIKKAGTYKTTLKSMKKGTWYVKVRTYKVINGKTIYSSYSVAKKIKITK